MIYYEDMISKYGFEDGEAEVDDSVTRRSLYVTAINHLAEKRKSQFRVVAWNRPGMHNRCMIVRVTLEEFSELGGNPSVSNPNTNGVSFTDADDEGFNEAVEIANGLGLDAYITSKGDIRKGAQVKLKALMQLELAKFE